MSFNSFEFVFFLTFVAAVYYLVPGKCRKYVLLVANCWFYLSTGWEKSLFLCITSFVVYFAARLMGKMYEQMQSEIEERKPERKEKAALQLEYKKKCKRILIPALLLLFGVLCYCKFTNMLIELWNNAVRGFSGKSLDAVQILVPLGISYYTFSAAGYLLDVYWRKVKYENNYLDFFLCMTFFPQMVQGPIGRYGKLLPQYKQLPGFEYRNFCHSLQLMLWGYFKKLVIADRLSIFVNQIFGNISDYQGLIFVIALMLSTVQLYADFSGCMDIVTGIGQMFGIKVDSNFDHPFASTSVAEFWRRWHVTLGAWFKDYVYFPIATSGWNIKITKRIKSTFGARAGKAAAAAIPLSIVWLLTGIWHGTGMNYVVWGVYYGGIIIISTIFQPEFHLLAQKLHRNTKSAAWRYFQNIRTFFIFYGGRLITIPGTLKETMHVIRNTGKIFDPWILWDGSLFTYGLNAKNFYLALWGIVIMWAVGHAQLKGNKIREKIETQNVIIRWCIYYAAVFAVLILGIYGAGYHASEFAYAGF